tara:strand:+ start:555 stop:785 length:231 start_codon:yes stop_codon:yes gene_type:complete
MGTDNSSYNYYQDIPMKEMKQQIATIEKDIEVIKNNHLAHIERSMERMEKTMSKLDNRMWGIVGIIIASAVGSMFI